MNVFAVLNLSRLIRFIIATKNIDKINETIYALLKDELLLEIIGYIPAEEQMKYADLYLHSLNFES